MSMFATSDSWAWNSQEREQEFCGWPDIVVQMFIFCMFHRIFVFPGTWRCILSGMRKCITLTDVNIRTPWASISPILPNCCWTLLKRHLSGALWWTGRCGVSVLHTHPLITADLWKVAAPNEDTCTRSARVFLWPFAGRVHSYLHCYTVLNGFSSHHWCRYSSWVWDEDDRLKCILCIMLTW